MIERVVAGSDLLPSLLTRLVSDAKRNASFGLQRPKLLRERIIHKLMQCIEQTEKIGTVSVLQRERKGAAAREMHQKSVRVVGVLVRGVEKQFESTHWNYKPKQLKKHNKLMLL